MKQTLAILCTAVALGLAAYAFHDGSLLAGVAAAIFLGLALMFTVQAQILKREMGLGQDELERWGDALSEATPEILERTGAGGGNPAGFDLHSQQYFEILGPAVASA